MIKKAFNQLSYQNIKSTGKRLILETPIEVAAGALLIGSVTGTYGYMHETAKRGQIPLAFSEISQIEFDAETLHRMQVPPLTRFYTSVNDVAMQIFEANNQSYNVWGGSDRNFAFELEKKIEPTFRIHSQIPEFADKIGVQSQQAQTSIKPLTEASHDLPALIRALDKSWEDTHNDIYRTEIYTTTSCNSKGSCTTTTHSRQVYDYTIHTYDYHPEQGRLAAELMQDFVEKHPDLRIAEELLQTSRTNAENEWAMRESRKHMPNYEKLTPDNYLHLANTWATGSNFNVLTPDIYNAHARLKTKTPQWQHALPTAKDARYRTFSHHDDGPREFQIAEAAFKYAVEMAGKIDQIEGGMRYAAQKIPEVENKIRKFVDIELHYAPDDGRDYKSEIIEDARTIYQRNFAGGFDVRPVKWYLMVAWAAIGMLAGAGIGFGVDRYIDKKVKNNRHNRLRDLYRPKR